MFQKFHMRIQTLHLGCIHAKSQKSLKFKFNAQQIAHLTI